MPTNPNNTKALILRLLADRPLTMLALTESIPTRLRATQRAVSHLLDSKSVRISGWTRSQKNQQVPVYAAGSAPSVPPPPRSSHAEAMRRYKTKKAAGPITAPASDFRTTWRFSANNRPAEGQKATS